MTGSDTAADRRDGPPERRHRIGRTAKRIAVAATGTSLLSIGVVLLVLPGPGLLVMIAGLAILATEFAWAERRLRQARAYAARAADAARRRRTGGVEPAVLDLTDPAAGGAAGADPSPALDEQGAAG